MPSRLRKAIGAVKDQTSISLAKVTNAANLDVIILKATTHDKNPIEERYVNEILNIVSSNKLCASACAHCIGKRIGKTRNWVVALKCLLIVLRIFQDGDPYFPREVFRAMKRGAKILNLSGFKDDSNSSPWDYTAFVRLFALYLDERLDCFLTGKLQRRFKHHNRFHQMNQVTKTSNEPCIKDMKPIIVLDRISHWQRLLDRAICTKPTGSARTNRLVQISVYAIVQESFDLYRDISDGLGVILDNFFHLPFWACAETFNACVKSCKQFDDLSAFYSFCVSLGIGRSYDYPKVQKVSEELMETLHDFFRDQAFLPTNNNSKHLHSPPHKDLKGSSSSHDEGMERCETLESLFETESDFGSQCTSLKDLMTGIDVALSPSGSLEEDMNSEQSDKDEKESVSDGYVSANSFASATSFPFHQTSRSSLDAVSFDELPRELHQNQTNDWEQQNQTNDWEKQNKTNEWEQQNIQAVSNNITKDCWELVLAKTVTAPAETSPKLTNGMIPFVTLSDQPLVPQHNYNPFLDDTVNVAPFATTGDKFIDVAPTFKATTTQANLYAQDLIVPTISDQSSSSVANPDLSFGDMYPNETSKDLTSFETNITVPSTFTKPSFQTRCSFMNDSFPTFQVHRSNIDAIMETPTLPTLQNPNLCFIPLHFKDQNFYASAMPPTFSAKDYNGTTLATSIDNDLFGTWPGENTNELTLNVSMQEDTLLRQQQLWLEQQQSIISKHSSSVFK
ncbi:clathrin coat assembly protein AP180-like [Vigna umbellata]|uniref:clathrin coat assembly protein AP180-like n=1 Tax=Vigna umbellata TaxID=87088 RepID=UPI001F5E3649|nr:clathrin coat assembly protein AP180-like [Vigna umbellata]